MTDRQVAHMVLRFPTQGAFAAIIRKRAAELGYKPGELPADTFELETFQEYISEMEGKRQ